MLNQIEILKRFKQDLYHYHTDKDLSDLLGIPASTISTWWKRGMCDMWVLLNHLGEYSADYLITGRGPRKLKDRCGNIPNDIQQVHLSQNEISSAQVVIQKQHEYIKRLESDNEFLKEQLNASQQQIGMLINMLATKE